MQITFQYLSKLSCKDFLNENSKLYAKRFCLNFIYFPMGILKGFFFIYIYLSHPVNLLKSSFQ